MSDVATFLLFMACFLFILAALGSIADSLDARERRDARHRNDQARRIR